MKRLLIRFALVALLLSFALSADAVDFKVGDFYFRIRTDSTCALIDSESISEKYWGDVVVPESASYHGVTYKVVEISAFNNNDEVKSVVIPPSILKIEGFKYCEKITTITIPQNVVDVGFDAFYGCI